MKPKGEMIRVLKTPEDTFVIDKTGRKNGRGAYLCNDANCLSLAIKQKGLERSFKRKLDKEIYDRLETEMMEG